MLRIITIVISIFLLFGCSPLKEVNCPPKFQIYKSINKAYPIYAKDFEFQLKNSINVINKLSDSTDITIKNKSIKLRQDLDNYSSMVENLVKSNLLAYFSGICDQDVRKNFAKFQERLSDLTIKLSEIRAMVTPVRGSNLIEKLNIATTQVAQMTENIKK